MTRALVKSLGVNFIGVVCVAISGFFAVLLMARWLDTAQFGTISILLLLFNSISLLDGIRPVLVYLGAQSDDFAALKRTAELMMACCGFIVVCAGTAVLTLLHWQHIGPGLGLLFSVGLGIYFLVAVSWGLLDSRGETAFTGGIRSVCWTLAYFSFIGLSWLRADIKWYVLVMTMMNTILLIAYATRIYVKYRTKPGVFDRSLMRRLWRDSLDNLIFNASAFVLGSADRFVLGFQRGPVALGLYSGAYELATKPAALLRVIAAVFYSEAARMQDMDKFGKLWVPTLKMLFFGATCVSFVTVLYREQIIVLLLGEKFRSIVDPFGFIAIGFVFVTLGYLGAIPVQARGNFRILRTIYVVAAILTSLLVWPAIAVGGIEGAAILYLATRSVDLAVMLAACDATGTEVMIGKSSLIAIAFGFVIAAGWYGFPILGLCGLACLALLVGLARLAMEFRAGVFAG